MELNNFDEMMGKVDNLEIRTSHFSWIYNTDKQRDAVSIPMIAHSLSSLKYCLIVVPDVQRDVMIEKLTDLDLDVERYISTDQLQFIRPESFLLHDGKMDKNAILELFQSTIDESLRKNWNGLFVVNDSSHLLGEVDSSLWLDIESSVDQKCTDNRCTLLCLFDDRLVSGSLVTTIIKIHPAVGMGDEIIRNPFYAGSFIKQDYPA